jgi:hypothetical protein
MKIQDFRHLFTHEWAIDLRHAILLRLILRNIHLGKVMEIGSFQGASTTALLEALENNTIRKVILVECKPTHELASVIQACKAHPSDIQRFWCSSKDPHVRLVRPEFVFIDGDHGQPAIDETNFYLEQNTHFIALHDTYTMDSEKNKSCWGTKKAASILRKHRDYVIYEDFVTRQGERTHRGFMLAVRNGIFAPPVHRDIHRAFRIIQSYDMDDLIWQ